MTRQVVEYAHDQDVTVEAELGVLAGIEDEVSAEHSSYTRPEEVERFLNKPVSIRLPFPLAPPIEPINLSLNLVKNRPHCALTFWQRLKSWYPVFHRAPWRLLGDSIACGADQPVRRQDGQHRRYSRGTVRKAAASAVCKVNIDSDGRLAMTAIIRQVFAEKPAEFDPRKISWPRPRRIDRHGQT